LKGIHRPHSIEKCAKQKNAVNLRAERGRMPRAGKSEREIRGEKSRGG